MMSPEDVYTCKQLNTHKAHSHLYHNKKGSLHLQIQHKNESMNIEQTRVSYENKSDVPPR